jgi:hypothetical protein
MHADPDQLLSQRDVADLRDRLCSLPAVSSERDHWPQVQARLQAQARSRRRIRRVSRWTAAASLAFLVLVGALSFVQRGPGTVSQLRVAATVPASAPASRLQDLHAQSRELEQLLAALPSRPAVARASTALPIDSLEAQVQWLDHRLSVGLDPGVSPQDEQELWRQRVEVMNSLVRLRYAEVQQVSM